MDEGVKGFGKGLGRGLMGVVVKPVVGVVDRFVCALRVLVSKRACNSVTDLTVGVKNSTGLSDMNRPLPVRFELQFSLCASTSSRCVDCHELVRRCNMAHWCHTVLTMRLA